MTENEWEAIAARIEAGWPAYPLTRSRRADYYEALADLDGGAVHRALDALEAEGRTEPPAAATVRAEARNGAPEFADPAPPPPPPPPPSALPPAGGYSTPGAAPVPDGRRDGPPGLATASLVLGICGWVVVPFISAVLAIIFGAVAISGLNATGRRQGRAMALWGLWLGITGLVGWIVVVVLLSVFDDSESDSSAASAAGRLASSVVSGWLTP